ncbi:hypothetical protein XELAEV_18018399mg [Xenopus laevis]|uniref:Uncharacterized protein n=1 Tax=Xenopus laevis TaxID=8355 RepID=A0A974DEY4_XENLA|nr:hypothetical protein XELAEV_18018399mg [Xenopus laevis]
MWKRETSVCRERSLDCQSLAFYSCNMPLAGYLKIHRDKQAVNGRIHLALYTVFYVKESRLHFCREKH